MSEKELCLNEFPEDKLELILSLSTEEQHIYFDSLIKRFFPNTTMEDDSYHDLLAAYYASFVLEKIYRNEEELQKEFTVIYTKTGLIRNMINDLYYSTDELIVH